MAAAAPATRFAACRRSDAWAAPAMRSPPAIPLAASVAFQRMSAEFGASPGEKACHAPPRTAATPIARKPPAQNATERRRLARRASEIAPATAAAASAKSVAAVSVSVCSCAIDAYFDFFSVFAAGEFSCILCVIAFMNFAMSSLETSKVVNM